MVDPKNIPAVMTDEQLEWWVLFGICVAGKSAEQTEEKLNILLDPLSIWSVKNDMSPFETIRAFTKAGSLHSKLRAVRMGQYSRIERAMTLAANLDVKKLTLEELEAIPGVGPKTARMILLYSDPTFEGVPLDTHILKFLKAQGEVRVPDSTPPAGALYNRLERSFVFIAKAEGMTVRELDTLVWKAYQSGDLTQLSGVKCEEAA